MTVQIATVACHICSSSTKFFISAGFEQTSKGRRGCGGLPLFLSHHRRPTPACGSSCIWERKKKGEDRSHRWATRPAGGQIQRLAGNEREQRGGSFSHLRDDEASKYLRECSWCPLQVQRDDIMREPLGFLRVNALKI